MVNTKKTILVVEDEPHLLQYNERKLTRGGFFVYTASTMKKARETIENQNIDLIVLDVMLPDGSGFDLCKEVKSVMDIPILFLTGKTQTHEKVMGLEGGGDYYMVKPYDFDELLAVVKSLLRRFDKTNIVSVGEILLDIEKLTATYRGEDLLLTPKEFNLLYVLSQHQTSPITAEELYAKCWSGMQEGYNSSLLWTQLSRLRKKLENEGLFYITNIRNKGYCIEIK